MLPLGDAGDIDEVAFFASQTGEFVSVAGRGHREEPLRSGSQYLG